MAIKVFSSIILLIIVQSCGQKNHVRTYRLPKPEKSSQKQKIEVTDAPRRKQQNTKTTASKRNAEKLVDYEALINELESNISEVESELQSATNTSNVDKIIELGQKHDLLTQELEKLVAKWVG